MAWVGPAGFRKHGCRSFCVTTRQVCIQPKMVFILPNHPTVMHTKPRPLPLRVVGKGFTFFFFRIQYTEFGTFPEMRFSPCNNRRQETVNHATQIRFFFHQWLSLSTLFTSVICISKNTYLGHLFRPTILFLRCAN